MIRPTVLRLPAKARTDHIPWCTYTDPELAQVGLTEEAARKAHADKLTVVRRLRRQRPCHRDGETKGFIKVMVVKSKPVG